MKVLQVNDFASGGGAEVVLEATVRLLQAGPCEVEVFTAADVAASRRPWSYIDSAPARASLAGRLEAFAADIVHLHNFHHHLSPGVLAQLGEWKAANRRRKVVMTVHDYHVLCPNPSLRWFGTKAEAADPGRLAESRYLLRNRWDDRGLAWSLLRLGQHWWNYRLGRDRRAVVDLYLAPSRYMARCLGAAGLPTRLVRNPVTVEAPLVERPGPDASLGIVVAGRISAEKGVVELIDMLPTDSDWTLTVVGDGPQRRQAEATVVRRELSDRVHFRGQRSHRDSVHAIASANLLILPSLWAENAPTNLVEALAVGTNILVSGLGGAPEMVEESGVGWIYDPSDATALTLTLEEITAAHHRGRLNVFDAAAVVANHHPDRHLEQLLSIYAGEEASVGAGDVLA